MKSASNFKTELNLMCQKPLAFDSLAFSYFFVALEL